MAEEVAGGLNREQLERLARYFEETVMSAGDYTISRAEVSHLS